MTDVQPELHNPTGCPVVDYADLNVPTAPAGWHFDNFDAKREEAPIHTGEGGGQQYFLLTRMEDIRKAYQSTDVFSNSAVTVADPNPAYRWIPEMLDGHLHTAWRQMLTPLWSPGSVDRMKPTLRQRFGEVLDEVVPRGECDIVTDLALLFPNVIFMDLMGLPRADAEQFQQWEMDILHGDRTSEGSGDRRMDAMLAVVGYFVELIARAQEVTIGRPAQLRAGQADRRRGHSRAGPARLLSADVHGRSRHGGDPDHVQLLAPRHASRGPSTAARRTGTVADGDRGVPALLRVRHAVAQGAPRHRDPRLSRRGGDDGPPALGLRQPRPPGVRRCRQGDRRPRSSNRHIAFGAGPAPLPRRQSRPGGTPRRHDDVARARSRTTGSHPVSRSPSTAARSASAACKLVWDV